jgi:hypothetical protein
LWKLDLDIFRIIRVSKRAMGSSFSSPDSLELGQSTDPSLGFIRNGTGSRYGGEDFSYPSWSIDSGYGTILLTLVVTIIILVIIHYSVFPILSFVPGDGGLVTVPIAVDQQLMFTTAPAVSDISANFVNLEPYNYTLSADVYLNGSFQASNMPRPLLYRARTPNTSLNATDTKDKLIERFPETNLIIWMDPIKNDLLVSVVTGDFSSTGNSFGNLRLQTTQPIENVPIRKVFRITVIFTEKFVEVYKDGLLEKSMTLKNTPISSPDNSYIFPTPAKVLGSAMVSNVAYWRRPLTSSEARRYGAPVSNEAFFSKKV